MSTSEVREVVRANVGGLIRVTPCHGEPHTLSVISVDDEGFTYNLLEDGQDPSIVHWWPFDEVANVEAGGTG